MRLMEIAGQSYTLCVSLSQSRKVSVFVCIIRKPDVMEQINRNYYYPIEYIYERKSCAFHSQLADSYSLSSQSQIDIFNSIILHQILLVHWNHLDKLEFSKTKKLK